MFLLVLRAYWKLLSFDLYMTRGNFAVLCHEVRRFPVAKARSPGNGVERICAAVDLACIWYWKSTQCLHRSAATACLLRRYGLPARMVIGAQRLPFKAHAWVEVEGRVVNDKPYTPEIYAVLERC